MVVAVKLLVARRAFEPEVRAEINDLATQMEQGSGKLRRHAVRQRQENDLGRFGQQLRPAAR